MTADTLRESIDSDYKSYIVGLLFLKCLSDRFEEEAEKLIAEGVSETVTWTDPDEHQFYVLGRARWDAIQKTATNIGEALNKACAALEEQNAALEGVLADIDYNDERKLGDARNRDTALARLVQHFSQASLRNDRMAEPDLLGRANEYLIEQFADDAGKKGEEAAAVVLEQQRPGWRNAKHARDWPRSLRAYAFPRIGAPPVSEVTMADVLAILTPIWHDKPETARRVRGVSRFRAFAVE